MKRKLNDSSASVSEAPSEAPSERRRLVELSRTRFPWMPVAVLKAAPLEELRFLLESSHQVTHTFSRGSVDGQ